MSCPSVRWAALDPRILVIARALLPSPIFYYGESHLDYEAIPGALTASPFNTPHMDARGSRASLKPFWSSSTDSIYRGYRFGIYLQDYKRWSGGLMVAVGSHRGDLKLYGVGAVTKLKYKLLKLGGETIAVGRPDVPLYIVPSEPGDLVIWNLRTVHSAGARRLVVRPDMAMLPNYEEEIFAKAPTAFLPSPGPRNAIFFDYGAPVEEVDLYIKFRSLIRTPIYTEQVAHWSYDDHDALSTFRANGIGVRFDPIIVSLCVRIDALRKQRGPTAEDNELRERLYRVLLQHTEFSPYFSLFSIEQFLALAARDRVMAVDYAIDAVLKQLASAAEV